MDQVPPRRQDDPDDTDYRRSRVPISGEEVQVGVGKYRLTLRGQMIIGTFLGVVVLLSVAWHVQDNQRALGEIKAHITIETARASTEVKQTMRQTTCVLSMTAEERIEWRRSPAPDRALMAYCPGLLNQ